MDFEEEQRSIELLKSLISFVPRTVLDRFETNSKPIQVPEFEQCYATILFVDISGFTALNERLAQLEAGEGPERVTKHLNAYFGRLIKKIHDYGGDVLKFAGDALICLFLGPKSISQHNSRIKYAAEHAVACALEIQMTESNYDCDGVHLSLHIGLGTGHLYSMHVGAVDNSYEYLVAGEPFMQLKSAVDESSTGEVVVSPETWKLVQDKFIAQDLASKNSNNWLVTGYFEAPITPCEPESLVGFSLLSRVFPETGGIGCDLSIEEVSHLNKLLKGYTPKGVLQFLESFYSTNKQKQPQSTTQLHSKALTSTSTKFSTQVQAKPMPLSKSLQQLQSSSLKQKPDFKLNLKSQTTFQKIVQQVSPKASQSPQLNSPKFSQQISNSPSKSNITSPKSPQAPQTPQTPQTSQTPQTPQTSQTLQTSQTPQTPDLRPFDRRSNPLMKSTASLNLLDGLRVCTVLFVKLSSLCYDREKKHLDVQIIHTALRAMQRIIFDTEGIIRQFLVDDKGTVLIAAFGLPPFSHEDDSIRGVQAAIRLHAQLLDLGINNSIGITTGKVFCGSVGSVERKEYAMVGDIVNLSARLMVAAGGGKNLGLLCDKATYLGSYHFPKLKFSALPAIKVKGKEQMVEIFQPILDQESRKPSKFLTKATDAPPAPPPRRKSSGVGDKLPPPPPPRNRKKLPAPGSLRFKNSRGGSGKRKALLDITDFKVSNEEKGELDASHLVGRTEEKNVLIHQVNQFYSSHAGNVVIIEGEAGMGKSALVTFLMQTAWRKDMECLMAEGDAIDREIPYLMWKNIFSSLFGLQGYNYPELLLVKKLMEGGEEAAKWRNTLALLNPVLDLEFPQSEFTEQLGSDHQTRSRHTHRLLTYLLQVQAFKRRLVIILDNCQWMDSSSVAFTNHVIRFMQPLPFLLVLTTRPLDDDTTIGNPVSSVKMHNNRVTESLKKNRSSLFQLKQSQRIKLLPLNRAECALLVQKCLDVDSLPEVLEQCFTRAQGNPFFLREMAFQLRDSHAIVIHKRQISTSSVLLRNLLSNQELLPDTVQGFIMSRIDSLLPQYQLVLKAASVIGMEFTLESIKAIFPIEEEKSKLSEYLEHLIKLDMLFYEGDTTTKFGDYNEGDLDINSGLVKPSPRTWAGIRQPVLPVQLTETSSTTDNGQIQSPSPPSTEAAIPTLLSPSRSSDVTRRSSVPHIKLAPNKSEDGQSSPLTPTSLSYDEYYSFKSSIICQVCYNIMTFAQRQQLHRKYAEWVEQVLTPEEIPYHNQILARHWMKAADDPQAESEVVSKALDYLIACGKSAFNLMAAPEAIKLLKKADDLASNENLASSSKFAQQRRQIKQLLRAVRVGEVPAVTASKSNEELSTNTSASTSLNT